MYESRENYLETILMLKNETGSVRSIDIARRLDFSKPSVSRAVAILKEDKYIKIDENGYITLTNKGEEKAKGIYERHRLLTKFFVETAKVDENTAEQDACKIEHIISDETFQGIKNFLKNVSK